MFKVHPRNEALLERARFSYLIRLKQTYRCASRRAHNDASTLIGRGGGVCFRKKGGRFDEDKFQS